MTPGARINAAIGLLDNILDGQAAEQALLRWSRQSRFAGSKDRAAVRDLVFDGLRRRNTLAERGGALSGRGLMIGLCRELGQDPDLVFTGEGHAPPPLAPQEREDHIVSCGDIPDWLAPAWNDALEDEAGPISEEMGRRAPVWLRVNPLRGAPADALAALKEDGIEAESSPLLAEALRVTGGERKVHASRAYVTGMVELQDLSPQLACAELPLKEGDRILDYCAGGGGKSLALAARQKGLQLYAHDADPRRMADLPARAQRAGARIECVSRATGKFDLVLVDVPCSGSGSWRRTPDAKWRLTSQRLSELCEIQQDILDKASALVAPGGYLGYMTCSVLEVENAGSVRAFLKRNSAFREELAKLWTPLTASDGFYLSLLQRGEYGREQGGSL